MHNIERPLKNCFPLLQEIIYIVGMPKPTSKGEPSKGILNIKRHRAAGTSIKTKNANRRQPSLFFHAYLIDDRFFHFSFRVSERRRGRSNCMAQQSFQNMTKTHVITVIRPRVTLHLTQNNDETVEHTFLCKPLCPQRSQAPLQIRPFVSKKYCSLDQ